MLLFRPLRYSIEFQFEKNLIFLTGAKGGRRRRTETGACSREVECLKECLKGRKKNRELDSEFDSE